MERLRGAKAPRFCKAVVRDSGQGPRSEEHTSELQSRPQLVCRLLLGKIKHTQLLNSNFVCPSMVHVLGAFLSLRCPFVGHFLYVALPLLFVVGYALAPNDRPCRTPRV